MPGIDKPANEGEDNRRHRFKDIFGLKVCPFKEDPWKLDWSPEVKVPNPCMEFPGHALPLSIYSCRMVTRLPKNFQQKEPLRQGLINIHENLVSDCKPAKKNKGKKDAKKGIKKIVIVQNNFKNAVKRLQGIPVLPHNLVGPSQIKVQPMMVPVELIKTVPNRPVEVIKTEPPQQNGASMEIKPPVQLIKTEPNVVPTFYYFKCPSPGCPVQYKQKYTLKRHMSKHHPNIPYDPHCKSVPIHSKMLNPELVSEDEAKPKNEDHDYDGTKTKAAATRHFQHHFYYKPLKADEDDNEVKEDPIEIGQNCINITLNSHE